MCNVRLSPENNARLFAATMNMLSDDGILSSFGLIPIMIGSVCDIDYARQVYNALPIETIVVNKFLGSEELISILTHTSLMVHPPIYDAYGMTIAEAAAVGVPTLIHHKNIGASSLFRINENEILHCDMNDPCLVSKSIRQHLACQAKLIQVSENARKRALSWNVKEYAQGFEMFLKTCFVKKYKNVT